MLSSSGWTRVVNVEYKWKSGIHLCIRLYRLENGNGLKAVGTILFEIGELLKNGLFNLQRKSTVLGGTLSAEVVLVEANDRRNFSSFRLQMLRFLMSEMAFLSDTTLEIFKLNETSKGRIWVKIDRMKDGSLAIDTRWNWPLRIQLYDSRHAIPVGTYDTTLFEVLRKGGEVTLQNPKTKSDVCEVTLRRSTQSIPEIPSGKSSPANLQVCVAIDFSHSQAALHSFDIQRPSVNAFLTALQKIALLFPHKQTYIPWGFGAVIEGKPRHIFQCGRHSVVEGYKGLQNAYISFLATKPTMGKNRVFDDIFRASSERRSSLFVLSDFVGVDANQIISAFQPSLLIDKVVLVGLPTSRHRSLSNNQRLCERVSYVAL
jgi:hypothetical protein